MMEMNEASDTGTPSPFDQFYAVQATDDDLIAMAEQLESICPGLGNWFMDIDVEFQRDLVATGYLFWEQRKAPCQCKAPSLRKHQDVADKKDEASEPSEPGVPSESIPSLRHREPPHGPSPLVSLRKSRGLSQKRLAELIGASQSSICRLEIGDFVHPRYLNERLRSGLEQVFELPIDRLIIPKREGRWEIKS